MSVEITWKSINLAAQEMLRFQCIATTSFKLIEGSAEIFGSELSTKAPLDLQAGFRGTILTFHGCKLQYTSETVIDYKIKFEEDQHLPNVYLNIHSALEKMRTTSDNDDRGPRILVCGNKSVGKTTFCRTLSNYAARKYRKIVLIDANVGLNDISIPGTISSLIVTKPYEVNEGWDIYEDPLVYSFGDLNPTTNISLFKTHLETLADNVNVRSENDPELFAGGCIISTSGVDKSEYDGTDSNGRKQDHVEGIRMAINAFEVNVLIVIEDGFLERLLRPGLPDYVTVIRIPKSSGAHNRSEADWDRERTASVKSYFHGRGCYKLQPHKIVIRPDRFRIFKIEKEKYSKSLLPMCEDGDNGDNLQPAGSGDNGGAPADIGMSITEVPFSRNLTNRLLAVSEAEDVSQLYSAAVCGFMAVLSTIAPDSPDLGTSPSLSVLSPGPEPPASCSFLLMTSVQYVDGQ